jgi:hypothetical protein
MQQSHALALGVIMLVALGTGCTHPIAFHPTGDEWHYSIGAKPQRGASLAAVVDETTAAASYSFRAASTGVANLWVANYGEMLEQVADVELPQLVEIYRRSSEYLEPATGDKRLTLVLTVPSYEFRDYRAKMTIHAEGFGPGRTPIFSKSYSSEGDSEAGKMIWAGALGQKSAVRQSSLDSFREIFEQMRTDIVDALQGPASAAP